MGCYNIKRAETERFTSFLHSFRIRRKQRVSQNICLTLNLFPPYCRTLWHAFIVKKIDTDALIRKDRKYSMQAPRTP